MSQLVDTVNKLLTYGDTSEATMVNEEVVILLLL